MTTTITQPAHYLDLKGIRYQIYLEHQLIVMGFETETGERMLLVIELMEDGEFLQLRVPQIINLTDQVYKGPALQTLATIQHQVKMLRLEYDPQDGDISASIQLPLEDANLTERQFNRALNGLVQLVVHHAIPRLRQTLATGIDPGAPNLAKQWVQSMPPHLRGALAEALQDFPGQG